MTIDDMIDLIVFVTSLATVGGCLGYATSPAWGGVAVGAIGVVSVLIERFTLRLVSTNQRGAVDESR